MLEAPIEIVKLLKKFRDLALECARRIGLWSATSYWNYPMWIPSLLDALEPGFVTSLKSFMTSQTSQMLPREGYYGSRNFNSHQLSNFRARTTEFQKSFFPRTIARWNSLPPETLACSSLSFFKHCLVIS